MNSGGSLKESEIFDSLLHFKTFSFLIDAEEYELINSNYFPRYMYKLLLKTYRMFS